MSITVLEVLENAKFNLENSNGGFQVKIAIEQLSNAIKQLEQNSNANEEFNDEYITKD